MSNKGKPRKLEEEFSFIVLIPGLLLSILSKRAVEVVQEKGKVCVLDIDIEGVKQVKKCPRLNPVFVFIKPPSVEELKKRLHDRNTETEDSLSKRLDAAVPEIEYGTTPGNFDIVILNEIVEVAYQELKHFISNNLILE